MELGFLFISVFLIAFIPAVIYFMTENRKQQTPRNLSKGERSKTKSSANSGSGDCAITPILVAGSLSNSSSDSASSNASSSDSSCGGGGGDGGGGC